MPTDRLYHLSRDGKALGKFDEGVMRELIRVGRLRPTDDYWTPGMKAWAKLAILPPKSTAATKPSVPPATSRPQHGAKQKSKVPKWTQLWPIPALCILALLIGYAATTNETERTSVRKKVVQSEPRRTHIEFTKGFAPFQPLGKELFPSHIIAFANTKLKPGNHGQSDAQHYGSPDFLAGVLISAPKKGDRFAVDVTADRFMLPSSISFTADRDARVVSAGAASLFDYVALGKVRQTTPFNVTIKVRRNDQDPVVFTEVWQAHQINDCPTWISVATLSEKNGVSYVRHHMGMALAGFINENHPLIDQILSEAKDTGICAGFVGYGESREELMKQVKAIWAALRKRGITYSNTAESTRSNLHSFQHVRMLEQCLASRQANCVDATAMLASILKKIGVKVGVILVPKHAYLLVYDQEGKRRLFAIESTGLANAELEDSIKAATEEQEHNLRKIERRLEDEAGEEKYHEIAIEDCRKAGIQPIPYAP